MFFDVFEGYCRMNDLGKPWDVLGMYKQHWYKCRKEDRLPKIKAKMVGSIVEHTPKDDSMKELAKAVFIGFYKKD